MYCSPYLYCFLCVEIIAVIAVVKIESRQLAWQGSATDEKSKCLWIQENLRGQHCAGDGKQSE